MKKLLLSRLYYVVVVAVLLLTFHVPAYAAQNQVNNVIILMYDGGGSPQTTLARWYKGSPLAMDEMLSGAVRTFSAESLITDSAPAATAFATGHKSNTKMIGVLPDTTAIPGVSPIPDQLRNKPVATLLEGAKFYGKSTGLVATSNIQHASPAGFSAHWPNRNDYNEIAKQQVYLNIDVVLGGGGQYLVPQELDGKRTDGLNLIEVLQARGYSYIDNMSDLQKIKRPKVWGLFAADDMAYDFDRPTLRPQEPSLAEMTQKAIDILSQNQKGFFLFVEGSKVDWADHANDPIGVISDLLAFDDAVNAALTYAKKDGHTLVLVFSDHNTGGMSIGGKMTNKNYDTLAYSTLISPLKKATLTAEGVEKMLAGDLSEGNIRAIVSKYYGIDDLTTDEIEKIQKYKKGELNYVLGPMASARSALGWTTIGHTGEDVFLYSYGPNRPVGLIDNTEIAKIYARNLGFDLADVDKQLFVEANEAFAPLKAKVRVDTSDKSNPVLIVEKESQKAELPLSQNIIIIGNKTYAFEGLTVLAPKTGKVYLPLKAVKIIKDSGF